VKQSKWYCTQRRFPFSWLSETPFGDFRSRLVIFTFNWLTRQSSDYLSHWLVITRNSHISWLSHQSAVLADSLNNQLQQLIIATIYQLIISNYIRGSLFKNDRSSKNYRQVSSKPQIDCQDCHVIGNDRNMFSSNLDDRFNYCEKIAYVIIFTDVTKKK